MSDSSAQASFVNFPTNDGFPPIPSIDGATMNEPARSSPMGGFFVSVAV